MIRLRRFLLAASAALALVLPSVSSGAIPWGFHFARTAGTAPVLDRNYAADGDSITSDTNSYSRVYATDAVPLPIAYNNIAVGGATVADFQSRAATLDAYLNPAARNILSVMAGNDLVGGTAAAFTTAFASYLDDRRAAGWTVVLLTTLPRGATAVPGFNAKRSVSNQTMRAWPGVHADIVVDLDLLTSIASDAAAEDTAKYPDNIHPNAATHLVIEAYFKPIMDALQGVVTAPTLSVATGTYDNDQSVTMTTPTPGSSIYYTLDASSPSTASTLYTGAVSVGATKAVKAVATRGGTTNSAVSTSVITLQVATPTFSPTAGSYGSAQDVTISTATTGAALEYSFDNVTFTPYSAAVNVPASSTLYARATKTGYTASATGSAAYTIGVGFITATGGTVTTDGDYKVHTFTSSADFVITSGGGNVEYLIGSGGGGGGIYGGGGGGAGGILSGTFTGMSAGTYAAVIGAGGSGTSDASVAPTNGSASSFNSISPTGGGKGAQNNTAAGAGGSGGGGNLNVTAGGAGTASQGSAGGTGNGAAGAGGGGAGAVGANPSSGAGAAGGAGVASSITGASVTYGGGGGGAGVTGGAGGSGGGGAGSAYAGDGTSGTANTSGGGGAAWNTGQTSGNGGSGFVILRYKFQ